MGPSTINNNNSYGDLDSGPHPQVWQGRGQKVITKILKFTTTVTQESFVGPHSVRVPSKTALASATCSPGTHSSDLSNP